MNESVLHGDAEARREALRTYQATLQLTNALIDLTFDQVKTPAAVRARSEQRMGRLRQVLAELGDPHRDYRIVHVGGTSGKGSTSVIAATLLATLGFSTGLHTSPYLQVASEKIQINGRLVDAATLNRAALEVIDAGRRAGIEGITYGEAWFAMTALIFSWSQVEVAVIEVGAGGRFDLTNVVEPDVSVITSVGFDHMESLGNTIEEIAWHKAGIIKAGVPVVSAVTDHDALRVITNEAESLASPLTQVVTGETFEARRNADGTYTWWETARPDLMYSSSMPGRYQATNAATAVTAVRLLNLTTEVSANDIQQSLDEARLPGRWERVSLHPEVILDGAHNPEKSAALVRDLRTRKQDRPGLRLVAVLGVLESKDRLGVLQELLPVVDELVTTSPRVFGKPGTAADALASDARSLGFSGPVIAVEAPSAAVQHALRIASPEDLVVVTGSLYLVGNVRSLWYADDDIVIQRTSWPVNPVDNPETFGFSCPERDTRPTG